MCHLPEGDLGLAMAESRRFTSGVSQPESARGWHHILGVLPLTPELAAALLAKSPLSELALQSRR